MVKRAVHNSKQKHAWLIGSPNMLVLYSLEQLHTNLDGIDEKAVSISRRIVGPDRQLPGVVCVSQVVES